MIFFSTIVVVALVGLVIHRALLEGLRNLSLSTFPGPWYSRFTSIPLLYARVTGNSLPFVRQLHARYGPIVRVGPTDISVNSVDGYYKIHGLGSRFCKSPIYDKIRFSESPVLFTIRDQRLHAERKRFFGRAYAAVRANPDWEAKVHRLVDLAVSQVKKEAKENGLADVYKWWRFLAVDVAAEMAYGQSHNLLQSVEKSEFFEALENANRRVVLQVIFSSPVLSLLKWSPIRWHRSIGWAKEVMFHTAMAALAELKLDYKDRNCWFGYLLGRADRKEGGTDSLTLSDEAMASEAATMIVAGSDSTAATMTYAVWEVLRRPDLRRRLEDEVAGLQPGFSAHDVESLPLLNNVLNETLRLYNPAGAPVERLAPKGGAQVGSWHVPEGTTVYTHLWLMARNEDVFHDAEK